MKNSRPVPIVLDGYQFVVQRGDMLLCICPKCYNEINWRHVDISFSLTAECCRLAMRAQPTDSRMATYKIDVKKSNPERVVWLQRANIVGKHHA